MNLKPHLIADLLKESLQQGQYPLLTVTSNSMAPLLLKGDQIEIESVTPEQLQPGDVIVTAASDSLITHRFWSCNHQDGQSQLITRGDRLIYGDPPWTAAQLVGRVISRRRQEQPLSLTTGSGQRLNRRLAQLAAVEMRLLPKSDTPLFTRRLSPPPSLSIRILHRLFSGCAALITYFT